MSTRQQPKTKRLMNWLLRSLLVVGQQPQGASQGFVLPTVVMVTLVVVLLTTAMVLRSFDRSKNASNFRVNETVLNATSPALDRAKAKIDALFADPALPRGTPSETEMYTAIASKERYTFGDETRLKVAFDIDGGGISTAAAPLQNQEVVTTAWRFPVDTDNNGKFDSYTLYGVYLRSPSIGSNGNFNRPRNPLEARSAPMVDDRVLDTACKNAFGGANSTSTFLSSTGWYRVNDVLKKSFFVYAATVPLNSSDAIVGTNAARYEAYKGNKGFSALELQQDRSRIPIYNAAVLYEDDLEVSPGPEFRLNGRVFTNSNLLTGKTSGDIQYYQVSGTNSCYIKNEENSKIVVGGNVGYGNFTGDATSGGVRVDLHRAGTIGSDNIGSDRRSAGNLSTEISYNSQVYTERIDFLVRSALVKGGAQTITGVYPNQKAVSLDPDDVKNNIGSRLNSDASLDPGAVRQEELERYLRQRTRRVPYIEAAIGSSIIGTTVNGVAIADANTDGIADANAGIFPTTGKLRPPDVWAMPIGADGVTSAGYTGLTLKGAGTTMEMPMTEPKKRKETYNLQEKLLGDRVFVGNNLPFLRYLTGSDSFVGQRTPHELTGKTWDDGPGTRYRETRIEELPDLGVTNRSGFWEKATTEQPVNALDNVGGLRVITGAGIYHNTSSAVANISGKSWFDDRTLGKPNPFRSGNLASGQPAPFVSQDATNLAGAVTATTRYTIVQPDSMPMTPGAIAGTDLAGVAVTTKPDLRMRATAVYHYKNSTGIDQIPIACISSYYDPTNATTANNPATAPWNNVAGGQSNNGIVYGRPYSDLTGRSTAVATYLVELKAQAQMMFPNGRIANEQLQNALKKLTSGGSLISSNNPLSLAENAAIDTAICSLKILDGTIGAPGAGLAPNFSIPHGAIREVSFLDARQVKAVDGAPNLSISSASSTTTARTYSMGNTGTLKKGDVVTIGGFKDNLATTGINEADLNVTRGTITAVAANSSITVLGGTSTAISATNGAAAKILEALTSDYNLSIEERQPLEVRATAIDLNAIKTPVGGSSPNEYLFPNSGIIYASRDDALLDLSAPLSSSSAEAKLTQKRNSPVDYRLDPSRRPNGILLENGGSLGRETNYRPEEKGLVLATDLPVYIEGNFNLHTQEEFTDPLGADWGNFYPRAGVNQNFACRIGQYAECDAGDPWRPATVLADAITPLSGTFRFGFRNEGDYDLGNQTGSKESIVSRRRNGFWNNAFAINGLSSGGITVNASTPTDAAYTVATASNAVDSSYFSNFVTPVQRRGTVPTYVMEVCRKLPISTCGAKDWVVGFDINGDGDVGDSILIASTTYNEQTVTAKDLGRIINLSRTNAGLASADTNNDGIVTNAELNWLTAYTTNGNTKSVAERLGAGTTARPILQAADRRYARRVAFGRDLYNALVFTTILDTTVNPNVSRPVAKPMGVGCPVDVTGTKPVSNGCQYPNTTTRTQNTHYGTPENNALWYKTTDSIVGLPGDNPSSTFQTERPLYYLPPDEGGAKLILPNLPDIAPINILNQGSPAPSDFTVCVNQSKGLASTEYQATIPVTAEDTTCRSMIQNGGAIDLAVDGLLSASTTPTDIAYNAGTNRSITTNAFGGYDYTFNYNDANNDGMTVVNFSGATTFENGSTITLDAGSESNAVFVIRAGSSLNIGGNCSASQINSTVACNGVVLKLNGNISPNNIIWVTSGSVDLNNANSDRPSQSPPYQATHISGTFMGKAGGVDIGANVNIDGGRFLGFSNIGKTAESTGSNTSTVTASADDGQPLVNPVVQLQVPTGNPSNTSTRVTVAGAKFNLPNVTINEVRTTKWLAKAPGATTFNLVAAAGDTPARPTEDNGGLHNLLRFLETWDGTEVKAFGSFVQFKRSVFATAPFQPIFTANTGPGGLFAYPQVYKIGNAGGQLPYYEPPNRNWGFDVALLKQRRPDLLAERFSTEPVLAANEFFREASRDDKWVQQLLCAKTTDSTPVNAINDSERPANCPTGNW